MNLNNIVNGVKESFKRGDSDKRTNLSDFDEKIFQELLESADLISEEQKKERTKILQQLGFQIAGRQDIDTNKALADEIGNLRESVSDTTECWSEFFKCFIEKLSEKRALINEAIALLKEKKQKLETDITDHKEKKKTIITEIEALKKDLITVRDTLAKGKKGIGEKLITEAEIELNKVVRLQRSIYEEVKSINEDRFKNTQHALDELIHKWKELRTTYDERFQILSKKIKLLGGDGINLSVANTLIALGVGTAGVAGYFFAIFSSKSSYSSNDVFYYLLNNILTATIDPTVPVYVKISYFVGALAFITGVSWLIDRLIQKNNRFIRDESNQEYAHNLAANFKIEGIAYDFKTKEKSWLSLWLKVVPIFLIVGMIILLLANSKNITLDTADLSASTEGLLIGTAIAMGLSAAVYVYITKITEPRMESSATPGSMQRNSEFIVAILLFLLSIIALAFYKSGNEEHQGTAGMYSIIGFIGCCLVTAFAFGYGLRFWGLISTSNELETQIDRIDEAIAMNSFPVQPGLSLKMNAYFTQLSDGLLSNLKKKNEAIDDIEHIDQVSMAVDDPKNANKPKWYKFLVTKPKKKILQEADLFEVMEWELAYFPEHTEQLKVLANLFNDKKKELAETEALLKNCLSEKESKEKLSEAEIRHLQQQIESLQVLILKVLRKKIQKEEFHKRELDSQITCVKDGFDLGLWYHRHGMGPGPFQILLNEQN